MAIYDPRPPFACLKGEAPEDLFRDLPTPCYILEEEQLHKNGEILASVSRHTGCKILLAQKAFSNFDLYPALSPYLTGTQASGLYEARLGAEEMPGREVHVFCTAYREEEWEEILRYADKIVFNSPRQLKKYGKRAKEAGKSLGLRINPECSTQEGHAIYDPCAPGSRLGTTRGTWEKEMTKELADMLDGLHFHTLCEQDANALEVTLLSVEEKFKDILPKMKWLNMGGGHHITRPGYDRKKLEQCLLYARDKWNLEVYLEPGEACALNCGYLASRVLDIVQNGEFQIAILDASAACHMPDVIEMPYTPPLYGGEALPFPKTDPPASGAFSKPSYIYRLAGPTCLAGDVIGDYRFAEKLKEGDFLLFGDMAIYSTCKNNTFNGIPLPDIWKRGRNGQLTRLTGFGYKDFKMRLGKFAPTVPSAFPGTRPQTE